MSSNGATSGGAVALKGALHCHTTCSDGKLAPLEVLRAHREQGFDFVALTDHDFLMMPGCYDGVPDEFEGMLVFKGVEKTVFARGYLHVNVIPGREEVLHVFNHPAEYDLTLDQVIDRMAEIRKQLPLHAVEVTAKGFYTPEFDTARIALPKIASDDSHTPAMIGRAWISVACERNHDAVLRAVKAGRARIHYTGTAKTHTWAHMP
jgi:predicted metal-dependent phosphoesterase TrpH